MENRKKPSLATVFIPTEFLRDNKQDGSKKVSLGIVSQKQKMINIVQMYSDVSLLSKCIQYWEKEKYIWSGDYKLILCCHNKDDTLNLQVPNYKCFLSVNSKNNTSIINCSMENNFERYLEVKDTLCIVYDAKTLSESSYFLDQNSDNEIAKFLLHSQELYTSLADFTSRLQPISFSAGSKINNISDSLHSILFRILHTLLLWIKFLSILKLPLCDRICSSPAVYEQLRRKYEDCTCTMEQYTKHNNGIHFLRLRNTVWRNGLDMFAGLCVMWWFTSYNGYNETLAHQMLTSAQLAATELQTLLKWMMGVPAGLKLNSQLDLFLGKFFLYHIYLWTAYLNILKPLLADALWYISISGCLGFSVQIALVQDLLSMMTLHIYCFYVYAARLYNLQMAGMSSLWRLFRGKKWNALRKRVDSTQYDVDQLFIGTLLFTILLFLLPTTALYYVVFLGLRVAVLIIQGCLYKMIAIVNHTPVYFLLLWLISPSTLSSDIEFDIKRISKDSTYLSMQLKTARIGKLLRDGQMQGYKVDSNGWWAIIHKITAGHLIYPWLEKS